ncbi:IS3 family transposase [Bacillus subtilis]|uniref:IS3 family transposase n=1 Tax=Bacillus subtilis TaxID=1423 RepID=UPI00100A1688|nr:IS3 family transposase [Bacillus subtilis]QAW10124.1 IS3 family transposase [Bacillus subtilis]
MARKGQHFQRYTKEFKMKAVKMYEEGNKSYNTLAEELGLRSSTQLKNWVKTYREGKSFDDQRGKDTKSDNPFIGRPKTTFKSVEEERDYLKAQVEYLKKRLSKSAWGGRILKAARFEAVHELKDRYPITWLVCIAKVSRSGYYKWRKAQRFRMARQQRDQIIKEHIMAIHHSRPFYGYPRITVALKKEGFCVNHKRVYRLMREMNIHSIIRKKRRYFGRKASVVLPNRLNREFQTNQPNQLYVTDITYIACGQRFYYLSAVQDLYNNEVVAWKLSKRNDLELVMKTVESLTAQRDVQGAILHSDQGFQYTTKAYQKRLETVGLKGSHSRKGNCLDNACIESFFSHLKTENTYFSSCQTEKELHKSIKDYIQFYNHERFQKKLNQCAPVEYRNTLVA